MKHYYPESVEDEWEDDYGDEWEDDYGDEEDGWIWDEQLGDWVEDPSWGLDDMAELDVDEEGWYWDEELGDWANIYEEDFSEDD